MKPPRSSDYVFGNQLSVVGLLGVTAYTSYLWWSEGLSPWLPFIAVLATGYGFQASERLQKYRDWKREWDAMDGKRPGFTLPLRSRVWRLLIGVPLLLVALVFAFSAPRSASIDIARALLVLAVFAVLFSGMVQRAFGKRVAQPEAVRDMPVTHCLKTPSHSPTVQQAFSALPKYCIPLFSARTL